MARMQVSEARENFAGALDTAQTETVILERRGTPCGVLISYGRYEQLMEALEDQQDVALFDQAVLEGGAPIPWEKVMADLGWL